MLPTSGFCAWKERGSIIECIYIYLGNNFLGNIYPPSAYFSSTSGFDNLEMENLSPRENEKSVVSVNEGKGWGDF